MAFTIRGARLLAGRMGAMRAMQSRAYADEMSFTFVAANQVSNTITKLNIQLTISLITLR